MVGSIAMDIYGTDQTPGDIDKWYFSFSTGNVKKFLEGSERYSKFLSNLSRFGTVNSIQNGQFGPF